MVENFIEEIIIKDYDTDCIQLHEKKNISNLVYTYSSSYLNFVTIFMIRPSNVKIRVFVWNSSAI